MPELFHVQSDLAAALRDAGRTTQAVRWLVGDADLVERRLAIYRANMVASADKALSAAYPVVRQVVGAAFFHGLAREHQRETPSTSGDLHEFGSAFPAFLAGFEPARSLPYLPDLARLEWAAHQAYGAADAPPWDLAALASVDPERQEDIRFSWTPGTAVIESSYPIVRIWTIHQPGHDGAFSVDWDVGERARVVRIGPRVDVAALAPGDAAFLAASLAGAPLGDAASTALAADPAFDLSAFLARSVASASICGFTLDPDRP